MARISAGTVRDLHDVELSRAARAARAAQAPIPVPGVAGPGITAAVARADDAKRLKIRRDLIQAIDPSGLERMIGERDIVSINFLARGLRAARSVCRLKTLGENGGQPDYASGFLVTSTLLMTNHHVLPDRETASRTLAEFDYELDLNFVERQSRIFPLAPMDAFYTSAALDFAIVAISPMGHDGTPIREFGRLALIPESGKTIPGEYVSIIQHPLGGTKQVVVRENKIITLDDKAFPSIGRAFIHYTADTERGSSGSPVFNDQWDIVALHHKAIADRNQSGDLLRKDGAIWQERDGEENKRWIANEGVRISALCAHLRDAAAFDADAARILAILAFDPHSAQRPRQAYDAAAEPKPWLTVPDVADVPAFETTRFADPAFATSQGFNPGFLGRDLAVPLPKTRRGFKGTLAKDLNTGKTVFDYTHFSLAMHAERRLALWTAVNIAGKELKSSSAAPGWRADPRLLKTQQTLAAVYGKVPGKRIQIDRGHLVRRLDPVWGTQAVADRAAADTFHYTNAAPQEHVFNSETWGNLEDFVLARADQRDHTVSVMTGPVLRPDDDTYGEGLPGGPWQIPWSFWKIAVFKRPDGTPSVTGFVVEQTAAIAPMFETTRYNPYSVAAARVFQRPIATIEDLTGLDFGPLRKLDRMGSVETTGLARPIRNGTDIIF